MKRILLSALAILVAMGLIGSSFAYFSDVETSEGNTFTAGTWDIELLVHHSPALLPFFVLGVEPGWDSSGDPYVQGLRNLGSIAGEVYITAENFAEPEDPFTGLSLELDEPDGGIGVNGLEVGPKDFADIVHIVVSHAPSLTASSWTEIYSGSLRDLDTSSTPVGIGAAGSGGSEIVYFKFVASLPDDLDDEDDIYEDTWYQEAWYIPNVNGNEDDNAYQADGVECDIVFYGTTEITLE